MNRTAALAAIATLLAVGACDVAPRKTRPGIGFAEALDGLTIEGVLVDSAGRPIAGRRVVEVRPDRLWEPAVDSYGCSKPTESDGYFVLRGLSEGRHELGVLAPGATCDAEVLVGRVEPRRVDAGARDVRLAVLAETVLHGTVGWDRGDFGEGSRGTPLADVAVRVEVKGRAEPLCDVTDDEGLFQVGGLTVGDVCTVVATAGTETATTTVTVGNGPAVRVLFIGQPHWVPGQVLDSAGNVVWSGEFTFREAGTARTVARAPIVRGSLEWSGRDHLRIRAGRACDAVVKFEGTDRVVPARTVFGGALGEIRLLEQQDVLVSGTLVNSRGQPLAGWKLGARRKDKYPGGGWWFAAGSSAAAGLFRVASWESGAFALEVQAPDGTRHAVHPWLFQSGTRDVVVRVAPVDAVTGRVVTPDGVGAARSVVSLRTRADPAVVLTTVTDDSGVFTFPGMNRSVGCDLAAEVEGFAPARYENASAAEMEVELSLAPLTALLEGRALDAAGAPLANKWIEFVADDGGGNVRTMTEAEGSFRTTDARGVDYEACPLVPGPDGRLVRGASAGRCRGGDTKIELRATK